MPQEHIYYMLRNYYLKVPFGMAKIIHVVCCPSFHWNPQKLPKTKGPTLVPTARHRSETP